MAATTELEGIRLHHVDDRRLADLDGVETTGDVRVDVFEILPLLHHWRFTNGI